LTRSAPNELAAALFTIYFFGNLSNKLCWHV
jgi:hypothetical protein